MSPRVVLEAPLAAGRAATYAGPRGSNAVANGLRTIRSGAGRPGGAGERRTAPAPAKGPRGLARFAARLPTRAPSLWMGLPLALALAPSPSALALPAAPPGDHPFHRSEAEGEFDPESGRLEVALRIDSIELELALENFSGRPVDLEQPQGAEAILFAYLRDNLRAKSRWSALPKPEAAPAPPRAPGGPAPAGSPAPARRPGATAGWAELHWVGYELEGLDAWLYFELELPARGDRLDWCNALLTERHPFQENLALLTDRRGRRFAVETSPDQPWAPVDGFLWRVDQRELPQPGWVVARPPFPHCAAWWQAQGASWRR